MKRIDLQNQLFKYFFCGTMNIIWISKISSETLHKTSRLKMSEALTKRGHKLTLCMIKKFGEKKVVTDNVVFIPTIHFPILSGFFYGLIVFFYFPFFLHKKEVDIIIVDCTKILLPFIIPLKILHVPLVLDIRTLPTEKDNSFLFKLNIYLSRFIVDGISTITPELYKILQDSYKLKDKKVGIWSSGASIADFNKHGKNDSLQIKIKDHKFTIVYHGKYSPTRGIENLIKAMGELNSVLKNNIRLFIIGVPRHVIEGLSKLSEKLGVKEQINILPMVDYNKITQYLNIADVGIIPLPPENKWWCVSAPLKTLEYLAAGKPIIATNIPFHQKIFEKGNCGVLIESNDPKVIADSITFLYKNQKDLIRMGEAGRNIVEKFYTWDIMAQEFEGFLKKIRAEY